jgi:hypothetical protein
MGTPWRPPFDSKTVIGPGRVDMKLNNSRHRRPYNVADSTVSVPFADWIRFEEWLETQQPKPSLTEAEQARAAHSIETVSGPLMWSHLMVLRQRAGIASFRFGD